VRVCEVINSARARVQPSISFPPPTRVHYVVCESGPESRTEAIKCWVWSLRWRSMWRAMVRRRRWNAFTVRGRPEMINSPLPHVMRLINTASQCVLD
jgi:hypothetical protein